MNAKLPHSLGMWNRKTGETGKIGGETTTEGPPSSLPATKKPGLSRDGESPGAVMQYHAGMLGRLYFVLSRRVEAHDRLHILYHKRYD